MTSEENYKCMFTELENKPVVKSETQKKLEADGWELLNHESLNWNIKHESDEKRQEYLKRQFKDVMIAEAHDINGNPIKYLKAVYVKR